MTEIEFVDVRGTVYTIGGSNSVKYTEQDLTHSEKLQARDNIDAQEQLIDGLTIKQIDGISMLGSGSVTTHFRFNQVVPSKSWTITHMLGRYPSVSVMDSAGTTVYGEVRYIDENSLRVEFTAPFSGSAFCS